MTPTRDGLVGVQMANVLLDVKHEDAICNQLAPREQMG